MAPKFQQVHRPDEAELRARAAAPDIRFRKKDRPTEKGGWTTGRLKETRTIDYPRPGAPTVSDIEYDITVANGGLRTVSASRNEVEVIEIGPRGGRKWVAA